MGFDDKSERPGLTINRRKIVWSSGYSFPKAMPLIPPRMASLLCVVPKILLNSIAEEDLCEDSRYAQK